jgi:hypothetical protein
MAGMRLSFFTDCLRFASEASASDLISLSVKMLTCMRLLVRGASSSKDGGTSRPSSTRPSGLFSYASLVAEIRNEELTPCPEVGPLG